jgi:NAD(P)-dependent dehydrogenase (short-subunit alcohol dehydrogenase family)
MQIKDSVFIVTGGASGLGAGTVRALAGQGGKVVAADLNKAAGEALAKELGAGVRFAECDVSSEASAKAAVDLAVSAFGGLNGTGQLRRHRHRREDHRQGGAAPAGDLRPRHQHQPDRHLQHDPPGRRRHEPGQPNAAGERGVIVNTASVAAFDGQIGQAAYSASKGGVVGMTLPIARDLSRSGIRVMTIAPGIFETPMLLGMPQEVQDALGKMVPFPPRLGKPAGVRRAGRCTSSRTRCSTAR